MRGRKPLPKHLRLVQGNRGKRPIRSDSVEAPPSLPMPPEFLCDDAKQEWQRVAPMLFALRLLSDLDVVTLAAYCQAYATWMNAHEALNKMGSVDQASRGLVVRSAKNNLIQNPLLGIANAAAAAMVRFAGELAMTPTARARITSPPGDGKNPHEKYFS